ncbi:extracellular solute-binding protein [Thermostaphylospora chromogena]|uniref:Carbohydrate ABC transporter substrate-binding protein, CUT1 family n=1 Tax=Thermostaphylospora chromogena TaxID=35622 RepID=A0A1H1A6B4_9ACTN|nr:extracellular solute-binding protein [Thermostaphylospora chromogena]SDQ35202.1 carbohydrate ABC transporter substrate-binding protein, CUT1 family [Thermostaphylospora chromogena]
MDDIPRTSPRTSPPPALTRRSLLGGALALGFLGSGCSYPVGLGSSQTRIKYWHFMGASDGVIMNEMVGEFARQNPDLFVEENVLAWGEPYYTKIAMAGAGGRSPDVASFHLSRLTGLGPGRIIDPINLDLLAENGLRPEDFSPPIWERAHVDGVLYAIPFDAHPMVQYYNTEICEKAGLLDGDGRLIPTEGPDALLEMLRKAKDAMGGRPPLVFDALGVGTVGPWRLWWSLYPQGGGTLLSEDGSQITIDDDKALEALRFMATLGSEGLCDPSLDYGASVAVFQSGLAAFLWNGDWEITTFKLAKTPFSMGRFPNVYGTGSAQADCHAFVLPHQRNRDPEVERATYRFIAYLVKNSADWAVAGHVPAYLPALEQPEYLSLHPQSEYRSVITEVALDPQVWFTGSASRLWIDFGDAFSRVIGGSRSPEEGLEMAKAALRRLMAAPNPFPKEV